MNDHRLYLAIGVPMLFNLALFTLFTNSIDKRLDDINKRFDDMRELWRSELHGMEEALDAWVKNIQSRARP